MKAIRKLSSKPGADLVDMDIPAIGRRDLLIKVKATAWCKSDVEVFEWSPLVAAANYKLPFTLGHEFAGEIVAVGEDVKQFNIGEIVAGETHIPCGYCHECRTGNQHICSNNMGVLGRNVNGSFAEYIRLPELCAIRLPKGLTAEQGALLEPLATALHALSKVEPWGKSVAILGTGTIGQMAIELARYLGATKIFAVDINDAKLAESKKRGADVIINGLKENFSEVVRRETNGVGVGAVVELTGNQRVINQAIDALQIAGKMVQVGMVEQALTIDNYMYRVVYREINMMGIFGRRMFETWELLSEILETGKMDLNNYIGAVMPMSDYEKGLHMFDKVNGRVVLIP